MNEEVFRNIIHLIYSLSQDRSGIIQIEFYHKKTYIDFALFFMDDGIVKLFELKFSRKNSLELLINNAFD